MPSSRKRVVDRVSVGEPPKKILREAETVEFVIYDFKGRKQKRGKQIVSPLIKAHGYEWKVLCFPRGHDDSHSGIQYVSLYLELCGDFDVTAAHSFSCKTLKEPFGDPESFLSRAWGESNFFEREDVIENLLEEDGSLVISCDIRIAAEDQSVWYPKNFQQQDILVELYQDASSETADVAFSVGETVYRAHKNILSLRGKKLYNIANEYGNDTEIPIRSVRGEIFKSLLDFVHTLKTPDIENEGIATELLVAADRFDCVYLKLYVESTIVEKFLNAKNAAALLVFADSHSCALLKEAAMNRIVTDVETMNNAKSWSIVKESNRLLSELLNRFVCPTKVSVKNIRRTDEDQLDVTTLLEQLDAANLDLDGSREVLVDRLKNHRQGK